MGHAPKDAENIADELYMWAGLITDHLQDQLKIRKGYLDFRNNRWTLGSVTNSRMVPNDR